MDVLKENSKLRTKVMKLEYELTKSQKHSINNSYHEYNDSKSVHLPATRSKHSDEKSEVGCLALTLFIGI